MTVNKTALRPFVQPGGIAVFGASAAKGSLGQGVLQSLQGGAWADRVRCINPKYDAIDARPCAASLDDVEGSLSLALIATPMAVVPSILEACGQRGIEAAVVYANGSFDDAAQHRASLLQIEAAARRAKLRVLGPRAMGYVLPHAGLNTTPVPKVVPPGNLGFVSQSNALCAAIFDWNHNNEFGFSAVFCPGEGADLELPEILDYLATDSRTETILLYLEGLRDARRFMSSLRAAASVKPVIAVKAGHHPDSVRMATSHSGGGCGDDAAFDAALRRAGVLRVKSIGDMFSAARALGNPCKPTGQRLAIVSNGGGPIVMAADCAAELNVTLATLSEPTQTRLRALLPPTWTCANPVDVLFDTDPPRYVGALAACLDDANVDGVLAVLSPNTFVDPGALARATIELAQGASKPLLTCWLGEVEARPARAAFAQARIPTFRNAENAVAGFSFVVNWVNNQALLQETPPALSSYDEPDTESAHSIIGQALAADRAQLTPDEARDLLKAFYIAAGEAPASASHAAHPRLRLSIRRDPVFGPVISLCESGAAAEIYGIRATALPPLNPRLITEMLAEPHLARLLALHWASEGAQALRDILLRISEMASELPNLHSLSIGVLHSEGDGARAGDVSVGVQALGMDGVRYRHMAICPYPTQFVQHRRLKDDSTCVVRPIRPEDATALQAFVRGLSRESKYFRFFSMVNELPQKLLARYTQIDYARELTLIATTYQDGHSVMLGEANYSALADGQSCEFALVVADHMAGKGLGAQLMRDLMAAAKQQGLLSIHGEVLDNNESMLGLMESLDFNSHLTDDGMLEVSRRL